MGNTKAGGKQSAITNTTKYGADFYSRIAKKSWENPDRNRKVGFAAMSKERHLELSLKGAHTPKLTKKRRDYGQETS